MSVVVHPEPEGTTILPGADAPTLFKKATKRTTPKLDALKAFATKVHEEEELRGEGYFNELINRPTFDRHEAFRERSGTEFCATIDALYRLWQEHRDAGFPPDGQSPYTITRIAWEAAQTDVAWTDVTDEIPPAERYLRWLFVDEEFEDLKVPKGWPAEEWQVGVHPDAQAFLQGKTRSKKSEDAAVAAMKKPKKEKAPKPPKEPKDLRSVFMKRLSQITPESLFRPWMATKALKLVTDPVELQEWADRCMADTSLYFPAPRTGEMMPAIGVDTETFGANGGASGLDLRIVNGVPQCDVAGICLSYDGIEGLYIPLSHEDGNNMPKEACREILQKLFDQCLLVFFNAKFDREILRITMGMTMRPYPYFEDVQVLHFLLDPKSDVDEDTGSFESAGLKALVGRQLGIEMIELSEIAKVKARYINPDTGVASIKTLLAPFNWIPTALAVPYAAADGLCTRLLWEKMWVDARKMKFVHKVDHILVDALSWVERQRPLIDVDSLKTIVKWHAEKLRVLQAELEALSGIPGFNPGSNPQLGRVLFETYGFPVVKRTDGGAPSTDADVIEELMKTRKDHPFLTALTKFKEYAALHPAHLHYEPRDHTARMIFKSCTVAGGRLAAEGGKKDGSDAGFRLNPQAIKAVGGNKWITARRLRLEDTDNLGETFDPMTVPELPLGDVHKSCVKFGKETVKQPNPEMLTVGGQEFLEVETKKLDVPRVFQGHVARYCGEWWSLAATEESITLTDGTVITLDAPKKVDANEVVNLRSLFIAPPGYTFFTVDYCLAPGTRVLTADLRWVPVEELHEGDELVGFDEHLPETFCPNRKLRGSLVEGKQVFVRPCIKVTTDTGTLICSTEHQWLTRVRKGGVRGATGDERGQYGWRKSADLQIGDEIARLCDPWVPEVSPEAGYLAGVFDGEGWVSAQTVGFGQKEGYVLDKVEGLLLARGYQVRRSTSGPKVTMLRLNGGRQETLKFLGSIRPGRLSINARKHLWEGLSYRSRYTAPARVLAIEPIGQQEVIALRTSTRTFIAEGLLSHNCNIEMRVAANCLAGDTKILIRDKGFVPIKDNLGKATVLDGAGNWVDSEIKSYGQQPLMKVRVGHNKYSYEFLATPNHRWVLTDGQVVPTQHLRHRQEIPFVSYKRKHSYASEDYWKGVRHGLIYGDGDAQYKSKILSCRRDAGYRIRLCGTSRDLVTCFTSYPVTYPEAYGGDAMVFLNDDFAHTHLLKELPPVEHESEDYMVGFFRGWFAADGSCSKTAGPTLCCGPEEEAWLRRVMPNYGYYFLGATECPVERMCPTCGIYVKTKKRILRKGLCCVACGSFVSIDAPMRFIPGEIKGKLAIRNKHSRSVGIFRPSLTSDDFLLDYKRDNFIASTFEAVESVRTVEDTGTVGEVFCAEVPTTHSFVIEGGLLTGNCSREPLFINEFLTGSGDFHTLTAKAVFPEFSANATKVKALKVQDPGGNSPDIQGQIKDLQGKMKRLRSLAKIINFALLYGGTEHTIYENMKAEDPTITKELAKDMVDKYWDSVPYFKEWAQTMQARARETMMCRTASGRQIDFKSAMRTQRIYDPLPEHWENYRAMWNLKKRAEVLEGKKQFEAATTLKEQAREMYLDKDTGIANLSDFKKFMGKIQRVSVNAPLQGLAGDFMRAALGYIYEWALQINLGDIMLLHSTVHDEIDFSVKNEYVPFVLPRVVRLMKLREMHAAMKWPVPIETDCEYGTSWDVKEHLTGDDTHTPAGWTKVPSLENYVPACFDEMTVKALKLSVCSTDTDSRQAAADYLKAHTHVRCHLNIPKLNELPPTAAVAALIAILQLHEYWTIEMSTPSAEDESLESYQIRMGLIPGEIVERPAPTPMDPEPQAAPVQVEPEPVTPEPVREETPVPQVEVKAKRPKLVNGYPILRDLSAQEVADMTAALGIGKATIKFRMPSGDLVAKRLVRLTEVPDEFLELEDAND